MSGGHLLWMSWCAGVLTLCAAGCDWLEPDLGPLERARCSNEDSDPSEDVSFERDLLDGIFLVGCADCHDPDSPDPIGAEVGDLDLSSYHGLRQGGGNGASAVVPGQPCASLLYQKILPGPPFGSRMPADGPPFLTDDDVRLVHDWIAEGAGDN